MLDERISLAENRLSSVSFVSMFQGFTFVDSPVEDSACNVANVSKDANP